MKHQVDLFGIFPAEKSTRFADLEPPYRYTLGDRCGEGNRTLVWCLTNPSTADAFKKDPTSDKVAHFTRNAHEWIGGDPFGRWLIVNAHAYQASKPAELRRAKSRGIDVIGPRNHAVIREVLAEHSDPWGRINVVVAWGNNIDDDVARATFRVLRDATLHQLSHLRTKFGHPLHPLYLAHNTPIHPYPTGGST